MSAARAGLAAPGHALADYFDALLAASPAAAGTPPPAAAAVPSVGAGRPRQDPFEAVIFEVHGLHLAMPAAALARVAAFAAQRLTVEPAGGVLLGVTDGPEGRLAVIDTAALVIPAARRSADLPPPRRILVIRDAPWALTASAIVGMPTLHPAQVQWRSARGRRPWLAGTVKTLGCGLLDVEALISAALPAGLA